MKKINILKQNFLKFLPIKIIFLFIFVSSIFIFNFKKNNNFINKKTDILLKSLVSSKMYNWNFKDVYNLQKNKYKNKKYFFNFVDYDDNYLKNSKFPIEIFSFLKNLNKFNYKKENLNFTLFFLLKNIFQIFFIYYKKNPIKFLNLLNNNLLKIKNSFLKYKDFKNSDILSKYFLDKDNLYENNKPSLLKLKKYLRRLFIKFIVNNPLVSQSTAKLGSISISKIKHLLKNFFIEYKDKENYLFFIKNIFITLDHLINIVFKKVSELINIFATKNEKELYENAFLTIKESIFPKVKDLLFSFFVPKSYIKTIRNNKYVYFQTNISNIMKVKTYRLFDITLENYTDEFKSIQYLDKNFNIIKKASEENKIEYFEITFKRVLNIEYKKLYTIDLQYSTNKYNKIQYLNHKFNKLNINSLNNEEIKYIKIIFNPNLLNINKYKSLIDKYIKGLNIKQKNKKIKFEKKHFNNFYSNFFNKEKKIYSIDSLNIALKNFNFEKYGYESPTKEQINQIEKYKELIDKEIKGLKIKNKEEKIEFSKDDFDKFYLYFFDENEKKYNLSVLEKELKKFNLEKYGYKSPTKEQINQVEKYKELIDKEIKGLKINNKEEIKFSKDDFDKFNLYFFDKNKKKYNLSVLEKELKKFNLEKYGYKSPTKEQINQVEKYKELIGKEIYLDRSKYSKIEFSKDYFDKFYFHFFNKKNKKKYNLKALEQELKEFNLKKFGPEKNISETTYKKKLKFFSKNKNKRIIIWKANIQKIKKTKNKKFKANNNSPLTERQIHEINISVLHFFVYLEHISNRVLMFYRNKNFFLDKDAFRVKKIKNNFFKVFVKNFNLKNFEIFFIKLENLKNNKIKVVFCKKENNKGGLYG